MKGLLVILSGPSAVGKDTVLSDWIEYNQLVARVVTYTTRDKRQLPDGIMEIHGVDYNFVTLEKFAEMRSAGAFIESEEVYGNWYATPKSDTEALLAQGKVAVLKIDVKGARKVMRLRPDALTIFLKPPSMRELEDRIRHRAADSDAAIQRRLDTAREEMQCASDYDFQIVNENIEEAVRELDSIVMARYRQVVRPELGRVN